MDFLLVLFAVHLFALIVPGPTFFIVSKVAISSSLRAALIGGVRSCCWRHGMFSLPTLHRLYARVQKCDQRISGTIFAAFGLRLILTSRS
jgi:threonine/homoserine/homoserine lactone efflux protein